jgi:hypothetical protein
MPDPPAQPSIPVPPKAGPDLPEGAETPEGAVSYTVSQIYYNNAEGIPFAVFPPVAVASPTPPTEEEIFASARFPQGNPNQGVRTTGGIKKGDRRPEESPEKVLKSNFLIQKSACVESSEMFGQWMTSAEGELYRIRVKAPIGATVSLKRTPYDSPEAPTIHTFGPVDEDGKQLEPVDRIAFKAGATFVLWSSLPGEVFFSAIMEGQQL